MQVKIYTHTHRTGNEEMRTVRKGERVRVREKHDQDPLFKGLAI